MFQVTHQSRSVLSQAGVWVDCEWDECQESVISEDQDRFEAVSRCELYGHHPNSYANSVARQDSWMPTRTRISQHS